MRKFTWLTLLAFLLICPLDSIAQSFDKEAIATRLGELMSRNYVFPEKGKAMNTLLKKNIKKGEYDLIDNPEDFANRLESDLRSIINDKHIRVRHDPERISRIRSGAGRGGRTIPDNHGFEKVEVKDDVGYLDLRGFHDISYARATAKASMEKLIKSKAIIIDLRKNGGGSPSMVAFLSSFFFEERTHLNTFYWRPTDNYSELWTEPDNASKPNSDIPVFILTSNYSFSAAEGFTYHLKHLKRVTVVGETTGGGAHPGGSRIINDDFLVNIPQGRAINPVTNSNWEGIGVEPHIKVPADQALEVALERIKEIQTNDNNK